MKNRATGPTRSTDARTQELETLANEILAAFFELRTAGQRLGVVTEWGAGSWGLLRTIAEEGPLTMSELARRRGVSRQYIQKLANELVNAGHLQMIDNPSHKRAGLMSLTASGRNQLARYTDRIRTEFRALSGSFTAAELASASATIARLRSLLRSRV